MLQIHLIKTLKSSIKAFELYLYIGHHQLDANGILFNRDQKIFIFKRIHISHLQKAVICCKMRKKSAFYHMCYMICEETQSLSLNYKGKFIYQPLISLKPVKLPFISSFIANTYILTFKLISNNQASQVYFIMNRPAFVFEEEQNENQENYHGPYAQYQPQIELHHADSQESEKSHHEAPPHKNKQENKGNHAVQQSNHHQQHETTKKRPKKKGKVDLAPSDDEAPPEQTKKKEDNNKKHMLLPEDMPRQRKKSTTYEQKVDLFHLADAAEMGRNIFVPQENASPTHQKNENFTFKPHHEPVPQYNSHDQHARTHQLKQQHEPKGHKVANQDIKQPIDENNNSNEKKKIRRLPSMNEHKVENVFQTKGKNSPQINETSTFALHKIEVKPERQSIVESIHHLEEDGGIQLKSILQPIQSHASFVLQRNNSFGSYIHPIYTLVFEGSSIITARKQSCYFNSRYLLTAFCNGSRQNIGYLQGNFGGTEFNLYEVYEGNPILVCTIIYDSDCSCCSDKFRIMSVYVKDSKTTDPVFERETKRKNLKELYEEGYKEITMLATKQPTWNAAKNIYTMNFGGKGKLPSVKNMILDTNNGHKNHSLLFCKTDINTFFLEINHSLSVFMAMGILMSSFDFKLFCQ